MAVRPYQGFPRHTEALHVDLVANPVPGRAEMNAVAGAGCLEVHVVVGIFIVRLQEVVIHILGSQLYIDRFNAQRLKFQHGHCSCGILKKRVVNFYGNLLTGNQFSLYQMGFQYFVGQVFGHIFNSPFRSSFSCFHIFVFS